MLCKEQTPSAPRPKGWGSDAMTRDTQPTDDKGRRAQGGTTHANN